MKPARTRRDNLFAEPALLDGYRKVSPDNVYFYAIRDSTARTEGFLIYDVPASALAEIDRYEGKRYHRENVKVNTANGLVAAQTYLARFETLRQHFGDRFHVNLIHELWLRKRIEKFIKKHTRPGERSSDAQLERRAQRELLATTERDLVISHYRSDAFSDFYLEHELDRPRPGIKHLYDEKAAQPFINNYLAMVVRQVLLNQFAEKIQARYRFELEHLRNSERYFNHSISLLIGLRMINAHSRDVDLIIERCMETMPYRQCDLVDYVKYAVKAADSIFDWRVARSELQRISDNLQPGLTPLGAEIELSNLGFRTVLRPGEQEPASDPVYNGFMYFYDFHLDILSWKLGGYIDDHTGRTDNARRRGFLELAPGRLNTAKELSRPATADPWLLNQLIHEITLFYKVAPHSLHLSFQLRRRQIGRQNLLPLGFVKCLLVLGGGLQRADTGRLWVSRMDHDEIEQYRYGEELVFARTSKRMWYMGEDEIADKTPSHAVTNIQQYKFIRLDRRANYEPVILALKGLQLAYNPADYLTSEQLRASKKLRQEFSHLKKWAADPTPIGPQVRARFLDVVKTGLMSEYVRRPAHKLHYIDWAMSAIDVQLRIFNQQLKKPRQQSNI